MTKHRRRVQNTKYDDSFAISNRSALVKGHRRAASPPPESVDVNPTVDVDPVPHPSLSNHSDDDDDHFTPLRANEDHEIDSFSLEDTTVHNVSLVYKTEPDSTGLFRIYRYGKPSRIPDATSTLTDVADAPTFHHDNARAVRPGQVFGQQTATEEHESPLSPSPSFFASEPPTTLNIKSYAPFDSAAEYMLVNWSYQFPDVNAAAITNLARNVISNGEFISSIDSLKTFDAQRSYAKMDKFQRPSMPSTTPSNPSPPESEPNTLPFLDAAPDAWYKGTVRIPMPRAGVSYESEAAAPHFSIDEVWYRKPMDAIRCSFEEDIFFDFHLQPFRWFYKRQDGQVERVYSESYTSDRAAEIQEELHTHITQSHLETVIVWIMLWSDSTHLAQFGTASLWPIYMFIGNLSKYIRVKPSEYTAHHLAYIPSLSLPQLPDLVKDKYFEIYGQDPTDAEMRFMKREVIQAIYILLFNSDLCDAYLNGVELIIPRSEWLCVRCGIRLEHVHHLGMKQDMKNRERLRRELTGPFLRKVEDARKAIFQSGRGVEGDVVKRILDSGSLTVARNAFMTILGIDIFKLICCDKLHEWDVGKVKDFLNQVVRILYSLKGDAVSAFDRRYSFRWVPTFGRGTIRRFHNNVSQMKKLAGRDYTAILECLMPVLEGLLPGRHDEIIQDITFDILVFNGHAKLRTHTDSSLSTFKQATKDLGRAFRTFAKDTSRAFETVELPREREARIRREAKKSTRGGRKFQGPSTSKKKSRLRTFNNNTAKTHALGDYPWAVKYYSTLDSFDTKIGEQEHKRVKSYYSRTNKNKHQGQIARHERRIRCLRRIKQRRAKNKRTRLTVGAWEEERLPLGDPDDPYQMASGKKFFLELDEFTRLARRDPAARGPIDDILRG
ncbi:hypothetical protein D9758_016234 [Tetrapyrgos nigripes]|uniref:Transposase n=1 Tax=Tetrapyrgos nigripes TaxID=182062 RepID=A0A8H5FFU4_9AGAR|nr:hypothetical protein D9758_016234 [Tetrapyrgos nigripes]